jgi:MFS family permease
MTLPGEDAPSGALRYLLVVPALALAACGTALFDNATLSLLPLAKMMSGMDRDPALALVTITMIGAVALQYPIGAMVDRYNKIWTLIFLSLGTGLGCIGLFALPNSFSLQAIYLFILGGAAFGVYSTTLALVADTFEGQKLVGANALLALCWGLGGLIGVPLVGLSIDLIGPAGFGWTTAIPFIAAMLIATRWTRRGIWGA